MTRPCSPARAQQPCISHLHLAAPRWADGFEAALLKQPLDNLTAGNWLDAPAAVDYFLATELTKNPDGYRGSIKMHKDRGGPLVMGPVWVSACAGAERLRWSALALPKRARGKGAACVRPCVWPCVCVCACANAACAHGACTSAAAAAAAAGCVQDYNEAFGLCCGYPINGAHASAAP